MSDYRLTGLNWRDFEHVVQALAMSEIAPGLTPFGDGKDGGREATFDGVMSYPSSEDPWKGYLVVQCKYAMDEPKGTAAAVAWIKKQLGIEAKKYLDSKRALRKPKYFLLATNIRLSAAKGGGKDQVQELVNKFVKEVGGKFAAVWSYDEICRFIDRNESVRAAYLGFITSGDVLAQAFRVLRSIRPEFENVIANFLQKQLLHDRSARLESAGPRANQHIPLAAVFVDLPASKEAGVVQVADASRVGFVAKMLEACSAKTNLSQRQTSRAKKRPSVPSSRFVVVGGPGQGKSTIAQYICQLYRAAIVRDRVKGNQHELPDLWRSIELIEANTQLVGRGLPSVRRFPVRIVLNEYATDLAMDSTLTILKRIQLEISRLGGVECTNEDVREWLKAYPWLIVFDGLDEVPASSNRAAVVREIEDFRVDTANLGADVVVLCTTRPQSYTEEFSAEIYEHWYLQPLSKEEALQYAGRLLDARYSEPDDPQRRQVSRRLAVACENDMTQKLMQSPLQVTIMTTLVEHLGEPPRQRYALFQRYYQTIYDREIGREGKLSALLSERRVDIDRIHSRTGLVLQRSSESAGGTSARLKNIQFEALFSEYLQEVGYGGDEALQLMEKISVGSFERLVFLTRQNEEEVSFELRSLQEYMAAEELFQGPEDSVVQRLQAIAPVSHWRNVMLFAVGKCFQERPHLLAHVHAICSECNDRESIGSDLAKTLLWGSRLALDILLEGVAQTHKRFHRMFCESALKLLEIPHRITAHRLAGAYHPDIDDLYKDAVTALLSHSSIQHRRMGWVLCGDLAEVRCAWASALMEGDWGLSSGETFRILESGDWSPAIGDWWIEKVSSVVPSTSPSDLEDILGPLDPASLDYQASNRKILSSSIALLSWDSNLNVALRRKINDVGEIEFVYVPLDGDMQQVSGLLEMSGEVPEWTLVELGLEFSRSPSKETLSEALRKIASDKSLWALRNVRRSTLPWPIAACVGSARSPEELLGFAERAGKGEMGSASSWRNTEHVWKTAGVPVAAIHRTRESNNPLDSSYLATGFVPFGFDSLQMHHALSFTGLEALLEARSGSIRERWIARLVNDGCFVFDLGSSGSQAKYIRYAFELEGMNQRWSGLEFLQIADGDEIQEEWIDVLDWLGRMDLPLYGSESINQSSLLETLVSEGERRLGLLRLVAASRKIGEFSKIPNALLEKAWNHGGELRRAAALVTVFAQDLSEPERLEALEVATESPRSRLELSRLLHRSMGIQRQTAFSDVVASRLFQRDRAGDADGREGYESIVDAAVAVLNSRRSGLGSPEVWKSLRLPANLVEYGVTR